LALATSAFARPATVTERNVVVKTADGSAEAVLFYPAAKGKWPAILLWSDVGGLRPLFRDIGRKFAAEGFVVLVPNPFYRSASPGIAAVDLKDPALRTILTRNRDDATDERISRDAVAYLAFLDAQKQTDTTRKAGSIGYDLGASFAFRTAAALPDRIAAVGDLYGVRVATERPNSAHLLVPKTKATYYAAMAHDDDVREPGDKDDIADIIKASHLQGIVEVYPADHGWANPAGNTYDAAASDRAFAALVALCRDALK
jgi:carboxymethylenebutenolidase